jgi:glycogen debranching enzyme
MRTRRDLAGGVFWGIFIFSLALSALAEPREGLIPAFKIERDDMTLDRLAQPQTYFDKAGRKFAILGFESGTFEAWAYPLKLLRNFELSFLVRNSTRPIIAEDIVRYVTTTPAATTLTYTYQSFTVKAVFVTAVDEPGAVIFLEVNSVEPLTIVAGFLPVLQPMWPAGIGGQYAYWDDELKAYLISEPTRKNHGYIGSPAAQGISYTPAHMLADTPNEFTIAVENPGEVRGKFIPIILAGGEGKREDIKKVYEKLAADPKAVYVSALEHYKKLRSGTLRIRTPSEKLNLAFEWAKVAYDSLLVDNPDLGLGLVAGLGPSGTGGRPGFGWFFGTDAYLNSLSLNSYGAYGASKDALAFTQKWQREDGKMAHELSQAASYLNWFKDYPYGYIHGDTTPYYIVATCDYYLRTGDKDFLVKSWPSLRRAYEWCLTTDADGDGLMDNRQAGLGALEFGSLTGIQTDIYLAAVWVRAAQSMEQLSRAMGDQNLAAKAAADYKKAAAALESKFWDPESSQYSYAFNADGKQVKELTPWSAVPLMWRMGSSEHTAQTLDKMCFSDLTTDWGVRMLSLKSPLYEPLNYNYGAVWPFLTGLVATALYKNDYCPQGYQLLLGNAGHVFDNALGCVTELFSGSAHIWPQEAVPHQGFSTGGVVLPLMRGMLGLEGNAPAKEIIFEPGFPPDWREVSVENVRLGVETFAFNYRRGTAGIKLEVRSTKGTSFKLQFDPALSAGTRVRAARRNGQPVDFKVVASGQVIRPVIQCSLTGQDMIEIDVEPSFEVLLPSLESRVGDFNKGLKILRLGVEGKNLMLIVEGLAGETYRLGLVNGDLAEGATGADFRDGFLFIQMPAGQAREFFRHEVMIRLK